MSEREEATMRLRWSLDRLRFLDGCAVGSVPESEWRSALTEHVQACARYCQLGDGARR